MRQLKCFKLESFFANEAFEIWNIWLTSSNNEFTLKYLHMLKSNENQFMDHKIEKWYLEWLADLMAID